MSVEVLNESGVQVDERALVDVARHVLDRMRVSPLAELAVSLVTLERMEQLHEKYMGEPGPTDVLAFPMDELDLRGSRGVGHGAGPDDAPEDTSAVVLGDVVLCPVVAERQAATAGHPTEDELHLLCAHGVLHLLGYDHAEPEEHTEMFGLQDRLLRSFRESRGGLVTRTQVVPLLVAAGFVVLAGALACLEVALARVSRVRVEQLVAEGRAGARRLEQLLVDPPRSLNLLLLLRLVCELTAVGIVTSYSVDRVPGSAAVALAVAVMAVVSYVLIGVAPRTIGRQQADRVALLGAPVAVALTRVFGPLPRLLILLGNALTPGRGLREGPFTSEAELRDLVDRAQERGVVEEAERDMIENVFELGDTVVREVMVPRTDMVTIERDKTVRQALNLALRSGFSRIPVVGENADDVVGVVYLKDLVRRERQHDGGAHPLEEVLREPVFVPDSKPVDDLLREMQTTLGHLALVVDEYGGTAGLVTIEDVLEEIVGEIRDEYDREDEPVERVDEDTVRVTRRLPVEDLAELYGVELPHEDVDSVGGLLASELGRVPIAGARVVVGGLELVAEAGKGRRNRVETVLVTRAPQEPQDTHEEEDARAGAGT